MEPIPSASLAKGATVRYWTGLKEGEGRIGKLSYDGIYELGETLCVYISGVGAVDLRFIEAVFDKDLEGK